MRRLTVLIPLVLGAVTAWAAPPVVTVPPDKLKPVAGYVRFTPDTDAKSVLYVPLDDAYPFPSEELKDPRRFVLPVQGLKAGKYRFVAVGTLNDEQTATAFEVTIGDPRPDPSKPPPVKPDPDPQPPAPTDVFYFAVIRADQNTAEFEKLMRLPAWDELRAKGHTVLDIPVGELPAGIDKPGNLPTVVVLRRNSDGKTWTDTKRNKPMPTTDEQIRSLIQ